MENKIEIHLRGDRVYGIQTWKPDPKCKVATALFSIIQRPLNNSELQYLGQMGLDIKYGGDIRQAIYDGTIPKDAIKNE